MEQTRISEQLNTRGGRKHQKEQISQLVSTLQNNGFRRAFPWAFGRHFVDSAGSSVRYHPLNRRLVSLPAVLVDGSESPTHMLYSGLKIDTNIVPGDLPAETAVSKIRSLAHESYNNPQTAEFDRPFYFPA